jgi:hypothetical protein
MNSNERLNFDINEHISIEISSATADISKKNIQKGRMKGEINTSIEVELEPLIFEETIYTINIVYKSKSIQIHLNSNEYNFFIKQLSKMSNNSLPMAYPAY